MTDKNIIAAVLLLIQCVVTRCLTDCKPKDCIDLHCYMVSTGQDGPHTVYPGIPALESTIQVSCEQNSDHGDGWTVMARRTLMNNYTSFNRTLRAYKAGFGKQFGRDSEFYLGNEIVHQITTNYPKQNGEIRVEGISYDGLKIGLSAEQFSLSSEMGGYAMHVGKEFDEEAATPGMLNYMNGNRFSYGTANCQEKFGHMTWWFSDTEECTLMYVFGDNVHVFNYSISNAHMFLHANYVHVVMRQTKLLFRPYNDSRTCDNPCLNGGTCIYEPARKNYTCMCPSTHCGLHCEKARADCQNGGTCVNLADSDHPLCQCPKSHCGLNCEIPNPCQNGGTCLYSGAANPVRCVCHHSHFGAHCEKANPCRNGGEAQYAADGSTRCDCPATHCGDHCEKIECGYNPCMVNPCKNDGTCLYNTNKQLRKFNRNLFVCKCATGYTGDTCTSTEHIENREEESTSGSSSIITVVVLFLLVMVGAGIMALYVKKRRDEDLQKEQERLLDEEAKLAQEEISEEEEPGIFAFLGF